MNIIRKLLIVSVVCTATPATTILTAVADPLVGRDQLKFSQLPMDGTPFVTPNGTVQRVWGHDELSTAYSQVSIAGATPYRGTFMADDFADLSKDPVLHVKWWGSYLDDFKPTSMPVNKFLISFESDHPVDATTPFSHPDQPLLNQIVTRGPLSVGSGTFTETLISSGGPPRNEDLYEYNAELHLGKDFPQLPNNVYWLKIVALVDVPAGINIPNPDQPPASVTRWGWHNRDYTVNDPLASTPPTVSPGEHIAGAVGPAGVSVWHFQDDAVTGTVVVDHLSTPNGAIMPIIQQFGYAPTRYVPLADGPPAIGNFSKDLAFELYTYRVPEPGTCLLFVCGCLGLAMDRRRPARG